MHSGGEGVGEEGGEGGAGGVEEDVEGVGGAGGDEGLVKFVEDGPGALMARAVQALRAELERRDT